MKRNCLRIAFVCGALAATAACSSPFSPGPLQASGNGGTLAPGDRVRILVFGEDQLTTQSMVGKDGAVVMPPAIRVEVAGLSPHAAEAAIARELRSKGIVNEPQVTVDVQRYRPIYVIGEVLKPGAYDYAGNLQVINAIAMAGGYTYRADSDSAGVMRDGQNSKGPVRVSDSTPLEPGDVLIVPERWF